MTDIKRAEHAYQEIIKYYNCIIEKEFEKEDPENNHVKPDTEDKEKLIGWYSEDRQSYVKC